MLSNTIASALLLINEFSNSSFLIPNSKYFYPFSSYDYEIGIERYKYNNEERALELEKEITRVDADLNKISYNIQYEVLENAYLLKKLLENSINYKSLTLSK